MNKINTRNQICTNSGHRNNIEYLAIFISAYTLFVIIWPVIFAVHDDIFSYIVAQKNEIFENIISSATTQGRVLFFITAPLNYFPFIFNNFVVYKLISYASICFSVLALGILLYRNISKEGAILSILLFFTFAQLDNQHNLLVSYVLPHQIAIGLILFSIERLLSYYKSENKRDSILSASLLLFSTILYEGFILFSAFLLCISLLHYKNISIANIKKMIIDLRFHIAFMLLFLIIYFIWKIFFPGSYDGAQFELTNIMDSLKVIFTYGLARVPMVSVLHNFYRYDFSMVEPLFIIKGIVAAIAVITILKKADSLNKRIVLYCLLLCILGAFLPVILHSVTPKYVSWVNSGSYAYLPSFYSYFFIITFISVLVIFVYQLLEGKKLQIIYISFLLLIIFSGSVLTDINNINEANSFQNQQRRYEAFDNAVSSEYFKKIENGSVIYIPEYNGIHNYMPYMDYYASIYSEKQHVFTNKIEDLTFENPTYGFHYDEISGCMFVGKLKNNMLVDNVYLVSENPISNMTAILNQNSENIINVVGSSSNFYGDVAVIPIQSNNTFIEFLGEDINLFSSNAINETIPIRLTQSIIFGEGFYQKEIWGNDIAYWCGNIGKFELYNTFNEERYVTVDARIATGDGKKTYSLILSGDNVEQEVSINASQQYLSFRILLQPGKNEFTFDCNAPSLESTSEDKRMLVFYVLNLNMKFENK